MNTLKAEDLRIGMHVRGEQLANIYGVWIYVNPETKTKNEYDILYFCDETSKDDSEIDRLLEKYGSLSVIYQNPVYEEEDAEMYE